MLLTGNAIIDKKIKKAIAGNQTLTSQHQVIAEWNYNAYTTISDIGCFYKNGSEYLKDPNDGCHSYYYSEDIIEKDNIRELYTPLKSIFQINRPKPGIVHSVYLSGCESNVILSDDLSIKNNYVLSPNSDRLYPINKDSSFKYWSSGRTSNNLQVGVSDVNGVINYAAPYIEYSDPIYINKVSIKTQKHLGYVRSFQVDVKIDGGSWLTIYQEEDTTTLNTGVLDIYYNGFYWTVHSESIDSPNNYAITDFNKESTLFKKIYGIRFIAKKMSNKNIPLEMIELSPRLIADLTNVTTSFDVSSSMSNSAYGLPIGSIVSSNGSIVISNDSGYFSKQNENSIFYNILKPNVEFKLYQNLTIEGKNYRFPLKTLYSDIWQERGDFTVTTNLEDYFKFFKEQTAPDLMIANKNGVPTSVAMLIFMDNIGFNNFRFEKIDDSNYLDKEDVILDYFYSKKEQTVMEVIESLAVSTQTAIYMDVDNELVAMTKEKMVQSQEIKDFWMIGDNLNVSKPSYYDGVTSTTIDYIANIESFEETSEPPITDISVAYNGLGFEKKSMALVGKTGDSVKAMQDTLERSDFGASTINQNLRYTSDIIWQPGNDQNAKDNTLGAAALIQDIPDTGPYSYLSNSLIYNDYTKEDVIKKLVTSSNDGLRSRMCIYLDKSYINTFTNNFNGYVLIDSELIKYYGICYIVEDPLTKSLSRQVFFSPDEYKQARAKLNQGGSIEPESLVVDLDFISIISSENSGKKKFTITGDGRGQNKTDVVFHRAVNTHKDFLQANTDWHRSGVKLWANDLLSTIVKNLTVSDRKETYLQNKTMKFNSFEQSFSGNLRLSGPKCKNITGSTYSYSSSVKALIPASNSSEQIITGIVKNITNRYGFSIPIRRLGTRMRLVSDVPKNVNAGDKSINNGVMAGIGWNIIEDPTSPTGMRGYFLEIEDVGTIDGKSLSAAKYRNLRLYRIDLINNKYVPTLLGNSWVNVSSTPNTSIDLAVKPADAKSYAQIFDLEVIITPGNGKRQYSIYWENQNVLTCTENYNDVLPSSSKVCLFVRGQSSAIYEYLYAYSSPLGINPKKKDNGLNIDYFYGKKDIFSRCYLPTGITKMLGTDNKSHILYYEEFGRFVREVKRFDIRYQQQSLKPKMISLSGFNKNYYVSDFETSSSGATFWLYNTSNGPITLDDNSGTPLWISGFQLKKVSDGNIQSSKLMEREDYDKSLDDTYQISRNLYGKQELQLAGEFINNRIQAENIARWVITKLRKERKSVSLSIFPNPLLKLGDKVGILYTDKYINDEKSYTIVSINHSISNSGPTMNIELKECV